MVAIFDKIKKWKLKGCPRCSGDLYKEQNIDESWSEQCLQCGYERELEKVEPLKIVKSRLIW